MTSGLLRAAAVAMLAMVFLAASAQAQEETLEITAHDDGDFYFTVAGLDGRNPTIHLQPGTNVTIEFTNDGPDQPHNLHFGDPIDQRTDIIDPGESRSLQFTVPSDASRAAEYWCDPHRSQDMAGDVDFDGGAGNGAPGPGFLLVLVPLAAAAAYRRQ